MDALFRRGESIFPSFSCFTPPPTSLIPARTVVSSYVLRMFSLSIGTENIRRTYEETTARVRPGQEGNLGAGTVGEENPERRIGEYHVRISD